MGDRQMSKPGFGIGAKGSLTGEEHNCHTPVTL